MSMQRSSPRYGHNTKWRMYMTVSEVPLVAVVDDDPSVLEAIENLLASARFAVETFDSAEAFLENLQAKTFDCLITDIGLPRLSGVALQKHVETILPGMPVILITGREEYLGLGQASSNNRGLFHKPFDALAFVAAINAAIGAKRSC